MTAPDAAADDPTSRPVGAEGAVVDDRLAGCHVLLTGATGFVGQALLERLLSTHPTVRVTALVRGKGSRSGAERLAQLLRKPVFSRWKSQVGAAAAARAIAERCSALDASLNDLDPRTPGFTALPADIDVVLHSASDVTFDPPVDRAFTTNVDGIAALYAALAHSGTDAHVVHVSTAYVGGERKGVLPEAPLTHDVDWRAELAAAQVARAAAEAASREPERLRPMIKRARSARGRTGPQAVALATEDARRAWVEEHLVDSGRTRAQSLGWTDVYTFTKALAERIAEEGWAAGGHRLTVVRPSVIEGALRHPRPGWIDGFKVADPLIIAYGRGQLPQFPGLPDTVLDVVPVDFVVNAVLAAAEHPPASGEPRYLHITTGARNPLPLHQMHRNLREFFTEHPLSDGDGPVEAPEWRFPGMRRLERTISQRERLASAAEWTLSHLPANETTAGRLERTRAARTSLALLRGYSRLYSPYVQTEMTFADDTARSLHETLGLADGDDRGFDVSDIDWDHYLQQVHLPAITALTRVFDRRTPTRRPAPVTRALPVRTDALAVFDLAGTVVGWNFFEQYLNLRLRALPVHRWPQEVAALAAAAPGYLLADRRDRAEFVRVLLRRSEGMAVAELQRAVHEGFAAHLDSRVLPDALARVAAHRRAGHRTVLVTGAVDLMVEPLAHHFDEVVASSLHVEDGVFSGYLDAPPLVGESRAAWLVPYAQRFELDLAHSYGYGDSFADVAWLELLGHPQAVNPDTRLERHARSQQWPVHSWARSAPNTFEIDLRTSEPGGPAAVATDLTTHEQPRETTEGGGRPAVPLRQAESATRHGL